MNEENEGEEAEEKFTPEEEFRNVSLVKRPATSSTRKRGKFSSLAKNKRLELTPVSLNLTGILTSSFPYGIESKIVIYVKFCHKNFSMC